MDMLAKAGAGPSQSQEPHEDAENVEPSPKHVKLGMKVRLALVPVGADDDGTEAINYGFEPVN
jgi:hypothetical protein